MNRPLLRSPASLAIQPNQDWMERRAAEIQDANDQGLGSGELGRGLRSASLGAVGGGYNMTAGAVAEALGADEAAQRYYGDARESLRRAGVAAPVYNRLEDIDGVKGFGNYVAAKTGEMLGSWAPALAATAVTRSPAVGLATMFPMEVGETVGEFRNDPNNTTPINKLLPTALAKGAVNTAIEQVPFYNMFGKGPLRPLVKEMGAPGRIVAGMGAEGLTEGAQEIVGQQAKSYLDPNRDRSGDLSDVVNAAAAGFFGSGPTSTIGAISHGARDVAEGAPDKVQAVLDRYGPRLSDRLMRPMEAVDLNAPTEQVAEQMAGVDLGTKPAPFTPEEAIQAGDEAVADMNERVAPFLTPSQRKKFSSLGGSAMPEPDDLSYAAARSLVQQHLRPDVELGAEAYTRATWNMIRALLTKKSVNAQDLHRLGSSQLMDAMENPDAFWDDLSSSLELTLPLGEYRAGMRTAQDEVKRPDSVLYRALPKKAKDSMTARQLQRVAQDIDDYVANPEGKDHVREALGTIFRNQNEADRVLEYYEFAAKRNGSTLAAEAEASAATPRAADPDEVLRDDTGARTNEVKTDVSYHYSRTGRPVPFRDKAAVSRDDIVARDKLGDGHSKTVSLLDYAKESGKPLPEVRAESRAAVNELLTKEQKELTRKQDAHAAAVGQVAQLTKQLAGISQFAPEHAGVAAQLAEAQKTVAANYPAQVEARIADLEQTAKALEGGGKAGVVIDPKTGRINPKLADNDTAVLSRLFVMRHEAAKADDQTATDAQLKSWKYSGKFSSPGAKLTFTDADGKPVVLDAARLLSGQQRRNAADNVDDAGEYVAPSVYKLRALESAVAAVQARGLKLDAAQLSDELVVGRSRADGKPVTLGALRAAARHAQGERAVDDLTTPMRTKFEAALLDRDLRDEAPVSERLEALKEAAKDPDWAHEVRNAVKKAISTISGRIQKDRSLLPDAKAALERERQAYEDLDASLRVESFAERDERSGPDMAEKAQLSQLRAEDAPGVRTHDETLVGVEDVARLGEPAKGGAASTVRKRGPSARKAAADALKVVPGSEQRAGMAVPRGTQGELAMLDPKFEAEIAVPRRSESGTSLPNAPYDAAALKALKARLRDADRDYGLRRPSADESAIVDAALAPLREAGLGALLDRVTSFAVHDINKRLSLGTSYGGESRGVISLASSVVAEHYEDVQNSQTDAGQPQMIRRVVAHELGYVLDGNEGKHSSDPRWSPGGALWDELAALRTNQDVNVVTRDMLRHPFEGEVARPAREAFAQAVAMYAVRRKTLSDYAPQTYAYMKEVLDAEQGAGQESGGPGPRAERRGAVAPSAVNDASAAPNPPDAAQPDAQRGGGQEAGRADKPVAGRGDSGVSPYAAELNRLVEEEKKRRKGEPPANVEDAFADLKTAIDSFDAQVATPAQEKFTPPKLNGRSPYLAKDQAKSDQATKFIGRGSSASSTAAYAKAWGDRANTGTYTADDVVFVSAEGARTGRVAVDTAELGKAVKARATIITDVAADRNRSYNVGEREVAAFLSANGYAETARGRWTPSATPELDAQLDAAAKELGFDDAAAAQAALNTKKSEDPVAALKAAIERLKTGFKPPRTPSETINSLKDLRDHIDAYKQFHDAGLADEWISFLREHVKALMPHVRTDAGSPKQQEYIRSMLASLDYRYEQNVGTARAAVYPLPGAYARAALGSGWSDLGADAPPAQRMTPEEQQRVIDEVYRLRGRDVTVRFVSRVSRYMQGHPAAWERIDNNGDELFSFAAEVAFADTMSNVYHESLHSFFSALTGVRSTSESRRAGAQMLEMMQSANIQRQLERLLAGHPTALEAARNDPEEAAAYAFQFWSAGAITLAPAPRGFFQRVAAYLRDVFGVLSVEQKIEGMFRALHEGRFAEPSLTAQVLADLNLRTFQDRFATSAGPVYQAVNAIYTSQTNRLRQLGAPALTALANEFDRRGGFLARRERQSGVWSKRLGAALGNASEAAQREALDALQARETAKSPEAFAVQQRVMELLNDMYSYMSDAGVTQRVREYVEEHDPVTKTTTWVERFHDVPVRKRAKYFPRVWDREYITAHKREFVDTLARISGRGRSYGESVYASVIRDTQAGITPEDGFRPYASAANNIRIDIPPQHLAEVSKFFEKDLYGILQRYTYQAVHRTEFTRSFGNDGESIAEALAASARESNVRGDDAAVADRAVQGLLGTLHHDLNPRLRQLMTNMIAYQNVVLLPLALFTNMLDPLHVASRSGNMSDAWTAFKGGIKAIVRQVRRMPPDEQQEFAEMLGAIDDSAVLGAYGDVNGGVYMTGAAKAVNDKFFRWNGMQAWNTGVRTAATQVGLRFLLDHSAKAASGNEQSQRFLRDLGVEAADIQPIYTAVPGKGNTLETVRRIKLTEKEGLTPAQAARVQTALYTFVDQAALRPSAAHRPIYGSDPRFMLLFHLRQFAYTFKAVTWKHVGREADWGNYRPMIPMLAYAPIGAGIDMVKMIMLGKPVDPTFTTVLGMMANRLMGVNVVASDAMNVAGDARFGIPGESMLGPTLEHGVETLKTLTNAPGTSFDNLMFRSTPLSPVVKAAAT